MNEELIEKGRNVIIREAFEKLAGIPYDVRYNEETNLYYWLGYPDEHCAINGLHEMYYDGKKSRQAEIDDLRVELEKAKELLDEACCYSHGEIAFADECQWCSGVQELLMGPKL